MAALAITSSCGSGKPAAEPADFDYTADRFADIEVLRYQVPGFEELTPQQRIFIYYLTEAAIAGRDILWDQNGKYNLAIRDLIEGVYTNYDGDRKDKNFKALETYLKQIEFASGIHHHYSMDKFTPGFTQEWLVAQAGKLPEGTVTNLDTLLPVIFDPTVMPKRVNQAEGQDLILTSANNLYDGVSQAEVENYFNALKDTTDLTPVSWGLNTRVVKENGKVTEQVYKIGGLYTQALERIVENLEKSLPYAENDAQKDIVSKLIAYFRSGDLKDFDAYSIAWAEDTKSQVDFINGFIEDYGDPLGMTGAYESIVNFKNNEASHRTEIISGNAQWFEDHSPVDPRFRKEEVKGVSAKVITAAILAGDAYPATPIGINLPNANWIRAAHGSKSVTLENITGAYDKAAHGNGYNEEFVIDQETSDLMDKYLFITDNLHTDLHECLGHGSGKLLPGVDQGALKAHGSTLEETRADLFALYYLGDPKLLELGLLDNPDAYKAEYYKYILNGLMTQLTRIEPGKDVEEAHMRNRQLIAKWALEKGQPENVIEFVKRDGKTFIKINDYEKLRSLFGDLLAEVQRIKSEGDYAAGAALVEQYAVKVDPELHKEVLDRYSHLNIAPYKGFVNPIYKPVTDADGNITDVTIEYGEDYLQQVLRYSKDYRTLPANLTVK
ncbi:dihydrofolate reductase [uncultured Duncaniella sp.]|uniref:dipeptidyl-peptidase 3 family protein n=1 Tax=uncultured Duncaniella sp. TaxID=2768039 RepID=UPI00265D50E9|nr:dihydrofolate reductase [uncultured Duncaniella sp.]